MSICRMPARAGVKHRPGFDGCDFLAELTQVAWPSNNPKDCDQGQHIPPKGVQYLRRYGLYASRTRGKGAEQPEIVKYAPVKWKMNQSRPETFSEEDFPEDETECFEEGLVASSVCCSPWQPG